MKKLASAKKVILSAFIVLNLFTVLFMNRPVPLGKRLNVAMNRHVGPTTAYRLRYSSYLVQRYAHLVGLDNRWQMFGRLPRFNWWYVIKARYDGAEGVVLPLAMQAPRTVWQNLLFDFKEGKFYLNIYLRPTYRRAYAYYLCRQFPSRDGTQIASIVYELHWQHLYPLAKAAELGAHLDGPSYYRVYQVVPCRDSRREEPTS